MNNQQRKTAEDLENEQKVKQANRDFNNQKQETINQVISEVQNMAKNVEEECFRKNNDQNKNQQGGSFDWLTKQVKPLKEKTDQLIGVIAAHAKLNEQEKQSYRDPVVTLNKILKDVGPNKWMNVKKDDKWYMKKFNETNQIVQKCSEHLHQLANAGCCGAGGIKKAIAAEFPKLKIQVDNFWQTIVLMKLHAKEGIEYQPQKIDVERIRDIISNNFGKIKVQVINTTVTEVTTKIITEPGKVQVKVEQEIVNKVVEKKITDEVKIAYELLYGIGRPQHISEGLIILNKEVRNNEIGAINAFGKLYYEGNVINQDLKKSFQYYQKSANKKDPEGTYRIGLFYENGDIMRIGDLSESIPKSEQLQKAVQYYKEAAKLSQNKHLDAVTDLGFIYEHGLPNDLQIGQQTIKQDLNQAINYYQFGVQQNFPRAMNNLGRLYQGQGKRKDAFKMFTKAIQQEGGYARASYNLGVCYQRGYGTQIDLVQSRQHYKTSYEKGDLRGKLSYAYFLLQDASEIDDVQGYKQVLQMLRSVLAEDKTMAEAYYYLGFMYENGFGISPCEETALSYYETAIEYNLPKAYNKMGEIFLYGYFGLPNDQNKAMQYFQKAAEMEDDNAMVNLGELYESKETEEGYKLAYEYYKKAARNGNHAAQTHIGELYRQGKGVQKDEQLAYEYLNFGAKKDGNARYLLEQLTTRAVLDQMAGYELPAQQSALGQSNIYGGSEYNNSPSKSNIYSSGVQKPYYQQIQSGYPGGNMQAQATPSYK